MNLNCRVTVRKRLIRVKVGDFCTFPRLLQAWCIMLLPLAHLNWSYSPKTLNSGQNGQFLCPVWLEICWMDYKTNRTPLLCCFKLCASFYSPETLNSTQNRRFSVPREASRVTLKFKRWHWETIGHLSYATSSLVHHFVAIGEFKLELQFGNAKFGSKSMILWAAWNWNLTGDIEKR